MRFGCPRAEVEGKSGTQTVEAVLAPLWDQYDARFDDFTPGQRAALLAWVLAGQVDNGGFHQYFGSSSGSRAMETVEGLRLMGAAPYVRVVELAASQFGPDGPPRDDDARRSVMDSWPEGGSQDTALSRLDEDFYALGDDDPLVEGYVVRYVTTHLDQFTLP